MFLIICMITAIGAIMIGANGILEINPRECANPRSLYFHLFIFLLSLLISRNPLLSILPSTLVLVLWLFYERIKESQRQEKLTCQLVDALQSISGSVQAGLSLAQSIGAIADDLPSPLGDEFKIIKLEIALGSGINDSLDKMSARCKNNDINLFITALRIQSQTGGNLTPILNNISSVIRERQKLAQKLTAATAQGKLSGIVIAGIPPFMLVVIQSIQPGYFNPLFKTTIGMAVSLLMVIMNVIGAVCIMRISSSRHLT